MRNIRIPKLLAKVEGSFVATLKDPHLAGRKLLLVRPQFVSAHDEMQFSPGRGSLVAVDSVGAGVGEMVLICQGSAARQAPIFREAPVDAVVMGIVEVVDALGRQIYSSQT